MPGETKYCQNCGEEIDARAEICPKCGVRVSSTDSSRGRSKSAPVSRANIVGIIGGVITWLGVFLPWMVAGGGAFGSGFEQFISGLDLVQFVPVIYVVLFGGILALLGGILALARERLGFLAPLGGVMALFGSVSGYQSICSWTNAGEVAEALDIVGVSMSVGIGVYVCAVGGILSIAWLATRDLSSDSSRIFSPSEDQPSSEYETGQDEDLASSSPALNDSEKLNALKEDEVISEDEFDEMKNKLLDRWKGEKEESKWQLTPGTVKGAVLIAVAIAILILMVLFLPF